MIKTKIFIKVRMFFILIIIFILLFYILSLFLNYYNILKNEEEKVEIYTSLIVENIDNLLKNLKDDFEFLGISLLNGNYLDIKNYIEKHKIIKEIFITDREKIVTISLNKELIGKKIKKDLSSILFPIYKGDEIKWYVGAFLNSDSEYFRIEDTIEVFVYKKWNLLIVDKNGYLIYHSNMIIDNIKDKNFSKHPSVYNALSGNWGLKRIKIDGKSYYTYSQFLRTTDWFIILEIDRKKIVKDLMFQMLPYIIFGFLIFILFFIGYIVINKIISRIENISIFINNYPSNISVDEKEKTKNDEISSLYHSFMNMIKNREDLEKKILQTIENERKRIGLDLHDDLGQTLTGLSFQLMLLEQELNVGKNKTFQEIIDLLEKSILKTKTIAKGLSPLSIYENNVFVAIEELLKNTETLYNIKYSFEYNDDIKLTDESLIINLYYILVEILNNIVKHSKANFILLKIEKDNNNLKILVQDNGIGFNVNNNYKGMGLKSIKYRVELINAFLTINSNSSGTKFELIINNK